MTTNKFILFDPTERRNLPSDIVACGIEVNGLEAALGCDFVVTNSKVPPTEKTIKIHANKGVSVQRKDIGDLVSSLQEQDGRLFRQLIRMNLSCSYPMLLIIGDLKAKKGIDEKTGELKHYAVVDGRETLINYFAVVGAIEAWQRRGGFVSWISRDTLLLDWCNMQLRLLQKRDENGNWETQYLKHKSPEPLPPEEIVIGEGKPRVLQSLEMMSRIESTLCSLPTVGPERARAIYTEAKKFMDVPTLIDCFRIIKERKVEGIGKETKEKILKYIGYATI